MEPEARCEGGAGLEPRRELVGPVPDGPWQLLEGALEILQRPGEDRPVVGGVQDDEERSCGRAQDLGREVVEADRERLALERERVPELPVADADPRQIRV